MRQGYMAGFGLAIIMVVVAPASSRGEVVFEDKGLYEKDTWNIQRYYDDLDNPRDARGIVTRGRDPDSDAGPALDFERHPGSLGPESGERQD
jgi:hypothetical protein